MDEQRGRTAGATGFEFTRRRFLRTTGAVGASAAVAGCTDGQADDGPIDPIDDLVDDGLRIVESDFVTDDGGWTDLRVGSDGSSLASDYGRTSGVRVVVRNELDEPIGGVALTVELFDSDLDFLAVQGATIAGLRPQEEFEGFVPYLYGEAGAFVVRAERSGRPGPLEAIAAVDAAADGGDGTDDQDGGDQGRSVDVIDGGEGPGGIDVPDYADRPGDAIDVAGDCQVDEVVRGTADNTGSQPVRRLQVLVRFVGEDGRVLGTATDTVTDVPAGGEAPFEVDLPAVVEESEQDVVDYEVVVGEFGPTSSAKR